MAADSLVHIVAVVSGRVNVHHTAAAQALEHRYPDRDCSLGVAGIDLVGDSRAGPDKDSVPHNRGSGRSLVRKGHGPVEDRRIADALAVDNLGLAVDRESHLDVGEGSSGRRRSILESSLWRGCSYQT